VSIGHRFYRGGRIAKKLLAGEIYAWRHNVPCSVIHYPTFLGFHVDYEIDFEKQNCEVRSLGLRTKVEVKPMTYNAFKVVHLFMRNEQ
jgi:hypothetical protein